MMNYGKAYTHQISQRALNHVSPVQVLKEWQVNRPELLEKRVYKQVELD